MQIIGIGLEILVATVLGVVFFRLAHIALTESETDAASSPPPAALYVVMTVSLLAVAAFLAGFYQAGPLPVAQILLILSVLWACAWADAKAFLIPNRVLLAGSMGALALLAVRILSQPGQVIYTIASTLVSTGALLLSALACRLLSRGSVGMGDVKLLGVMGLCLAALVWGALFCSFVAAFVYCVFLLVAKKAKRSDSIPFAPLLLVGTVLVAFLTGV